VLENSGGSSLGESIWGRGSTDNKSGLIGILYVIYFPSPTAENEVNATQLICRDFIREEFFKPTRTIVLAFSFDEEASGLQASNATLSRSYLGVLS
jgi:Gly-Xaa carboxypeptidase